MIKIICVGKLKERYWSDAEAEYLKRLSKYAKVEVIELKEHTDKNPEVSKRKEGDDILGKVANLKGYFKTILNIKGKPSSSEEFSTLLKQPNIAFIIGGPEGLDERVEAQADAKLSLSAMTFTHQMTRVILIEQVYRGFTILSGEKYHR